MHRQPFINHLDDPVQEYIPLIRTSQTYTLTDLPKGKYIVCGEAMDHMGEVYQESCLEIRIRRMESKGGRVKRLTLIILIQSIAGLQGGVQALIVISLLTVMAVIVYAILYQICKKYCGCGSPADKK